MTRSYWACGVSDVAAGLATHKLLPDASDGIFALISLTEIGSHLLVDFGGGATKDRRQRASEQAQTGFSIYTQ